MLILFLTVIITTTAAENRIPESIKNPDEFLLFASNASGRYYTMDAEDLVVLDLIPVFGRLFASVGLYMGGESLYSYYAAELLPLCPGTSDSCPYDHSQHSFDVYIRFFSNMSMAGDYWPGETFQRLTVVPGGLLISGYVGDGDGLVSKESVMMSPSGKVPSMFPYGPEKAGSMYGDGTAKEVPEYLSGIWKTSLQTEEGKTDVQFSVGPDGTMVLLREADDGRPPLLLKGGFVMTGSQNDSCELCYLMSSPSSGTMPYSGCVRLEKNGTYLTAWHSDERDDDLFLPNNAENIKYEK